jgi:hypothetical protein
MAKGAWAFIGPSGTGQVRYVKETEMRFVPVSITAALGTLVVLTGSAFAASYTLFGDAEIVSPGAGGSPHAVEADGTTTGSGIIFDIPAGTTFAGLDALSTDYLFIAGTCQFGSPRFQVRVVDPVLGERNIFVYIGPPPNYTPCPTPGYVNTGDLLEGVNPIDTSQLTGGTFYDPYTTALLKYGDYIVKRVSLVVDPGYGQIVRFDNTVIDETLYTYDQPQNKDECKNGGWTELTRADGTGFKNQGDCIQYVNTGK